MLAAYRTVLREPGALAFTSSAFLARLPIAMIGLGIVLFVSGITGSYARAGILTAAFALSAAIAALWTSRLIDRYGQRAILPTLVAIHATALILFVLAASSAQPFVVQLLVIVVAGSAQPAIGSAVRARWVTTVRSSSDLRSAFALESILDELMFTLGPLLTTILALQIALPLPILVAAAFALIGTLALASQRRTEPAPNRTNRARGFGAIRSRGMPAMVIIAIGCGMVFGSYEVSVVAFTDQQGSPGFSGVVLALWAGASMFGGLWFGARAWRSPLPTLLVGFAAILFVAMLPTPFLPNIWWLAVSSVFSGFAIAPVLISVFSLTERLVPPALLTEGLTWSNSGLALGFALGTSATGWLIDTSGTAWGFGFACLGAALAATSSAVTRTRLLRAMRTEPHGDEPGIALNDDPIAGPGPSMV